MIKVNTVRTAQTHDGLLDLNVLRKDHFMRKPSPNAESMEKKILDAFFSCVYKYGLSNSTIRTVAKEAGISPFVIQYYFKTKENLINSFMLNLTEQITASIKSSFSPEDSPEEKLQGLFDDMKQYILKRKKALTVVCNLYPESVRNSAIRKICHQSDEKIINTATEVIDEGVRKGVFNHVNPKSVAKTFVFFVLGCGIFRLTQDKHYESNEILEDIEYFICTTKKTLLKKE